MSTRLIGLVCIASWLPVLLNGQNADVVQESSMREANSLRLMNRPVDQSLFNDVGDRFDRIEFSDQTVFASAASRVVAVYQPAVKSRSAKAIAKSARKFMDSLNSELRKRLRFALDDKERQAWTNLPARPNAGGVRLGEMNVDQMKTACDLLAHLLSPQGYEKVRLIMLADDQLLKNNQPRPGFGTENFAMAVFGKPSETKLWSIQLDGHHMGLNVAVQGDRLTIAPSFVGTQPVKFQLGQQTVEPMKTEIDAAFLLSNSLSEAQFKQALLGPKRGQLRAGPGRDGVIPPKQGVSCKSFDEQQRSHLMMLIAAWVGNMPRVHAVQRMQEIEAEIDQMYFSWQGFRKTGSDVSYSIQGPSLLIEFAYQDLGHDPLNHLHTQYRNLKNDYGQLFETNK